MKIHNFKIALVNLPYTPPMGQSVTVGQHLGLAYIASYLRQNGYNPEIVDAPLMNFTIDRLHQYLNKHSFEMVGITTHQGCIAQLFKLCRLLKTSNPNIYFVIGGPFASLKNRELLEQCEYIDAVVLGEGEATFLKLAECIRLGRYPGEIAGTSIRTDQGILINEQRDFLNDLDVLPYPADDYYNIAIKKWGVDNAAVVTSRGCYGNCAFCSVPSYLKKYVKNIWRKRSAACVLNEVERIIEKWGITKINFNDDNFFGPGKNGKAFAQELIEIMQNNPLRFTFNIFSRINDIKSEKSHSVWGLKKWVS